MPVPSGYVGRVRRAFCLGCAASSPSPRGAAILRSAPRCAASSRKAGGSVTSCDSAIHGRCSHRRISAPSLESAYLPVAARSRRLPIALVARDRPPVRAAGRVIPLPAGSAGPLWRDADRTRGNRTARHARNFCRMRFSERSRPDASAHCGAFRRHTAMKRAFSDWAAFVERVGDFLQPLRA